MKVDTIAGLKQTIDTATLNIARLEERQVSNAQERLELLSEAKELGVEPGDLSAEATRIFTDVETAVQSVSIDIAKMRAQTDA